MRGILVYCAKAWRVSTWLTFLTAGPDALSLVKQRGLYLKTCPPLTHETFPYGLLSQVKLAYFRLHGKPGQPYLYGDRWQTALSGHKIAEGRQLDGLIVFLEGCYGLRTGLPEIFLERGALAVIGSTEDTRSRPFTVGKSSRFGRVFVRSLLAGNSVRLALATAKVQVTEMTRVYALRGDKEASYV